MRNVTNIRAESSCNSTPTISAMKLRTLQVPEGCLVKYLVWNSVFDPRGHRKMSVKDVKLLKSTSELTNMVQKDNLLCIRLFQMTKKLDFSFRKLILSWTRTEAKVGLISTKGAEVNPYLLFSWCLKPPDLKSIVCLDQATQYHLRWCHKLVRPHPPGHRMLSPRVRAQVRGEDEVWCPGRRRRACPKRQDRTKLVRSWH